MASRRLGWLQRLSSLCAICHGWSAQRICPDCCTRFAPRVTRCRRCALQVPPGVIECGRCLRRPPPFDSAFAAVDYGYPWAALIARLKFDESLDLAGALGSLLCGAVAAAQPPAAPGLLLPVPLAPARLRERGYNQSWEVARHLARYFGTTADARLLLRVRETAPQQGLPMDQRAGNIRGAFAVEPLRRAGLHGRAVTLVDDVITTGETAGELARMLKAAGASTVAVWVVARTPPPSGEPA